jgi:hypothetical protein
VTLWLAGNHFVTEMRRCGVVWAVAGAPGVGGPGAAGWRVVVGSP